MDLLCIKATPSTIYLNTPPIASFTATNVCANENILLTNTSVASSDAGIESTNWIYVDGGINIPSIDSFYLYQNINEFEGAIVEAIIIVSDSNNCIDSDTVSTIEIHPILNWMEIYANELKYMKIRRNSWKNVRDYGIY